ncbi:MAG: YdcF family protein [Alphaproteobacteria bacterium]|nr:YdcF family protein [Alphaproteobacteria bacterium]
MKNRIPRRIKMALLALVLASFFLSGLFWFVRQVHDMQPPGTLIPHDAVIVLTGGTKRMEQGFDLLDKGMGAKLFISGVYRGIEARTLVRLVRDEDEKKLECCIVLGSAQNTIENAEETAAWMRELGLRSAYLVTSNYHMKRALSEFKYVGGGFKVTPFPVAPDKLDMKSWWHDPDFRWLIVREYTKYLLARVRHGVTGVFAS